MGQQQEKPSTPLNVAITGLDAHGKSTYLSKLLLGGATYYQHYVKLCQSEILSHHKIETVHIASNCKNINGLFNFTIFDCNILSHKSRVVTYKFWKELLSGSKLIVFMVDSNDRERIEEVQEQFYRMMELVVEFDCKLLIVCSKIDLPNILSSEEIVDLLNVKKWNLAEERWALQSFEKGMSVKNVVNPFAIFVDGLINSL